jgi:SAM-dependent methyltransferase
MPLVRLESERQFHNLQAAQRARSLRPHEYRVDDDAYLAHESWIAPAIDMLGDLVGKRLLDLGCGHGMASVVLARRGARVTGCDLSLGYLREARTRADVNRVTTDLLVCDGERLPFADGVFDRIWGNAILHHLDMCSAAHELKRVLAPGGIAVFCEPWGENRWLSWARQSLPYPGKQRTADEAPLGRRDLAQLRSVLPDIKIHGFQLLSMLGRVVKQAQLTSTLTWCDRLVLRHLPTWQRYCRYVVLTFHK